MVSASLTPDPTLLPAEDAERHAAIIFARLHESPAAQAVVETLARALGHLASQQVQAEQAQEAQRHAA